MDTQIIVTPLDIYHIVLAVCGAIVTVSAAVAIVSKIISKVKEPNEEQNKRIKKLEEDVSNIYEHLEEGTVTFISHSEQLKAFETSMKRRDEVMIESFQVLISHAIDGNNIESLKEQQKKISKYLLER